MTDVLQQILNGISLGATYALLALGLAIVFSILHLVNFAHGELITLPSYAMLGMYHLGLPWYVFAPAAVVIGGVAGLAMERLAFRPVRRASPTTMLLTSFGLSIIIQSLLQIMVSPRPQAIPQPGWLRSSFLVAGLRVQSEHLLTILVTAAALLGLVLLLRRSLMGTAMRAAAEDFDAVRLMGIKANRVVTSAFFISGALAGIAAILILSRRGTVNPHMGLMPVLSAFVANVIGGIGSLWGAVLGGFLLGFVEVALRAWLPSSVSGFTTGFLFLIIAVLLLFRPAGLFGARTAVRV